LFYIVHLEALKLGMQPIIRREPRPMRERALRFGFGVSGRSSWSASCTTCSTRSRRRSGGRAVGLRWLVVALYVGATWMAAKSPRPARGHRHRQSAAARDLAGGQGRPALPAADRMLIWCLMVEEMSPALSAFWAIAMLMGLMVTQRPLIAAFRRTSAPGAWSRGFRDVIGGLTDGSRNMIGIGVATATAGIVVGAITLTGLALRMTEFVEFVSQGNVVVMLLFIAFVCLVLGLGVPTTANYVLVATLMAPVVVELGAQAGLVIPLIAVHLFVFYYGIIGDITPPVGLATFAAAAISGEDAIATGIQGAIYAMRT
jgi:TRAP-type uncharacterized transport system fused permease subunit